MTESQRSFRVLNAVWVVALATLLTLQPAVAAKKHELPTVKPEKVGCRRSV